MPSALLAETISMITKLSIPSFISRFNTSLRITSILGFMLLVSACATQAPEKETEQVGEATQLVWPAPPEKPRIRYLGSLKSLEDVAGKQQKSLRDILMGEDETAQSSLQKPYGVHSDSNGRVFVADTGIAGLVVFDIDNKNVSFWGVTGMGKLKKPVGVTSDASGNVYVSDIISKRIVVFDRNGNYLNAFGGEEVLANPTGLVYNEVSQRLYVADTKASQIFVFDADGQVDFVIGEKGTEPGQFKFPTNLAVDADGRLYVADSMNFRIQIFAADGTFISSFGEIGDRPSNFNRLKGIGVDTYGHIYAVDASYNNFQIFDKDGALLMYIGHSGTDAAGFYLPAGAHVDRNNRIFVADQYNRRIQMFEYIGEPDPSEPEQ